LIAGFIVLGSGLSLGGCADDDDGGGADSDTEAGLAECDDGRYDESTGLCWQHPTDGSTYGWHEATDYCAALNLGGRTDWYLPSRDDFLEMLGGCDAYDNCDSCYESETCTDLFGADNGWYWTSSTDTDGFIWYVEFDSGSVYKTDDDIDLYVRCVRGGT
jgi:hypothetical protein